MNRLTYKLALLATVLAVVTGACGSSTTTPSAGATNPPAAGPTAAAPAASAANPGGGTADGKFCTGMKITFFPGGTAGGSFETVVYNGAKAAQAAFGPTVTYQWSDWDPNKMITQFQQAVATKPDGIAVMGHPGDASFDALIDDAVKQGILITVMNTELPKAEAAHGLGYTGAVLHDAGAYGAAMSSNYVSQGRVPQLLWDAGRATLIARRETVEDLVAAECDEALT